MRLPVEMPSNSAARRNAGLRGGQHVENHAGRRPEARVLGTEVKPAVGLAGLCVVGQLTDELGCQSISG